jgi:hypothetical protein
MRIALHLNRTSFKPYQRFTTNQLRIQRYIQLKFRVYEKQIQGWTGPVWERHWQTTQQTPFRP